jgi:ABC-type antimicrobial peptide transport system permease subunit
VWIGLVVGVGAAFALTRTLSGVLYGVSPTDPLTFGTVAIFVLAIASVACAVPARRAARIDPVLALKNV